MSASEESRAYRPLEDEPLLFEKFVNTPDSADGILSFANRYGALGIARQFVQKANSGQGQAIRMGESLSDWIGEVRGARVVVTIWELCSNSAGRDLEKYIKWHGKRTVYLDGQSLFDGLEYRETIASSETGTRPHLLKRWKPGETIGPAKALIACGVNRHLRQGVSPQLLMDRTDELRPYIRVFNLLGAIWYQVYHAYSGRAKVRRCSVCNGFFTFERKTKTMHERCAGRIRQQRFREAKGE